VSKNEPARDVFTSEPERQESPKGEGGPFSFEVGQTCFASGEFLLPKEEKRLTDLCQNPSSLNKGYRRFEKKKKRGTTTNCQFKGAEGRSPD